MHACAHSPCCRCLSVCAYALHRFESSAMPKMVLVRTSGTYKPLRNVFAVSSGAYHSACLAGPGLLYTWGAGHCLGRRCAPAPAAAVANATATAAAAAASPTSALRRSSAAGVSMRSMQSMTSIAAAAHAQPPLGDPECRLFTSSCGEGEVLQEDCCTPTVPPFYAKRRAQAVCCGENFVLAKNAGAAELHAWGQNSFGQLGVGTCSAVELLPLQVQLPHRSHADLTRAEVLTGGRHCAFLCNGEM